ncbi:hypothetical protein EDC04DRAFT_2611771 [Pisolithus marmoratus]|nr:hypothetical protein EDC04DRAFT_2611771 [Pisolithus marmoratus]
MASNNNTAGTNNTINQGTDNTINWGTTNNTIAGTSNTMQKLSNQQATDMAPAIAAALNISLTEDTIAMEPGRAKGGESSSMNLDSAAPMDTEGGGADPNTEQEIMLHQCNHDKLKLIVHTALSPEFGLGLAERAWPKAHELVGKLVDELKLCSEIAVHHLQCPTEPFEPKSQREMDILYPLDIPDPMSAEDTSHYKDKQLSSGIANLSSLPTFDNAAKALWIAEKNAAQAEQDRQLALSKQHEKVKVIHSVRAERAAKVDEMKRVRPSTPQTTLKRSHEEAGSPGRSPVQQKLDIGSTDMSQCTMAYSWEGFKTIAKEASPDIAFKELPALLYLLLMVLDLARSKLEAKSKVESIIQMVEKAQEMPDPQMILSHIVGLQGLGHQAPKYVKKAQELVTAGTAIGMISVKEAAQWFE